MCQPLEMRWRPDSSFPSRGGLRLKLKLTIGAIDRRLSRATDPTPMMLGRASKNLSTFISAGGRNPKFRRLELNGRLP